MSAAKKGPPRQEPPNLEGAVEKMAETTDGVELSVRIRNPLNRAIHYIADVRGILFDPATRRLRVQLSDQGRELVPGGLMILPRFRTVDPNSETVMTVRLPKTIVKLAEATSPTGDVLFEEHTIANANEIELDIGWSDTPFYPDPREKSRTVPPVADWEKQTLVTTYTPPNERER